MDDYKINTIGEIAKKFMSELRSKERYAFSQLIEIWPIIVGEKYSKFSRVHSLEKGVLIIKTNHPGVLYTLKLDQTKFLNKIRATLPDLDIYDIFFKIE